MSVFLFRPFCDIGMTSSVIAKTDLAVERSIYNFKCFRDHAIECEIKFICRLLGYYGNIVILLDHFLELFVQSSSYRKQAAFCLNEIVAGLHSPPASVPRCNGQHRFIDAKLESMVRYESWVAYLSLVTYRL